ncbi:MAG: excinuclease ABC subunit C [Propionibacterium sp.]|nr:MAG: excinuclease ABC subunit C [Propionibacterium sp.]
MADPASYRPAPGTIPTQPGVYRFSDAFGNVIYVGKAKNLRSRLNSYFADPESLHFRTQTMVRTAERVDWTVVQTELEALQLEHTWIREYDPRFNVRFRDDKSYPWLIVTWSEEFPRAYVGRGAQKKGNRYFGPYGAAWAIRDTVDALLKLFPIRSCRPGVFRAAKASGQPCLLGDIGKCSAPCVGRISADEHRELVNAFCRAISGTSRPLIRRLRADMKTASADLEFERAAMIRDQIQALESVSEKHSIIFSDDTNLDAIALAQDDLEVAVQIFHVRAGRVRGERGWIADRADNAPASELMTSFLLQHYQASGTAEINAGPGIPTEILVSDLPEESIAKHLSQLREARVRIRVPQRGDKRVLVETVQNNAKQLLAQHKLRRASDLATRNRALTELQEALGIEQALLRIECYDISHTGGQDQAASMVVFEDGLPRKSEYRKYSIRGLDDANDVAAMKQVLMRRLSRLRNDELEADAEVQPTKTQRFSYPPSLIVVDGGQPQVAAAAAALEESGFTGRIALCGIAKRLEEVWLPDEPFPIILPRNSEGLYLMQRLRDEAHRFAITHHRSKRSKQQLESVLDQIPGLGKVRQSSIWQKFGSLTALRKASTEEIAAIPGIGPALAEAIADRVTQLDPAIDLATGEILD